MVNIKIKRKQTKPKAGAQARPRQPGPSQEKVGVAINQLARSTTRAVQLPKPPTLPPYVHCLIDPVNAPAARLPDEYVSETGAHKLTVEYDIKTDANGVFALIVSPAINIPIVHKPVTGTLTDNTVVVGGAPAYPDGAEIKTAYTVGRLVAMGIEVEYIGAPLNASGKLHCIEVDQYQALNTIDLTTIVDDGESDPLLNGKVIHVRPIMPPRFESPSVDTFMRYTFNNWVLYATGAPPNTVVASIKVTAHFEGIAKKGGLHAKSGSVELYNPDHLTIGANIARHGITAAASDAGRKFMRETATKAAGLAWANLGPQVANTMSRYGGRGMLAAGEALLAIMP